MTTELFEELDRLVASAEPGVALEHLIARLRETGEFGLMFEARLMRKRWELGLPLIQSDQITGDEYQQAVMAIARETGGLFLAAGNIARAWPYYRAIGDVQPIEDAIAALPNEGDVEQVIAIAFQEGVHPLKGLELILANQGMCRAITAFGMTAVQKDREKCIAMLARHLYGEIVPRMKEAIAAQEGAAPESERLVELMAGREWLFGEWDYYVDTSHLLSVIPYGLELKDAAALECVWELCEYGKRLAAQFQSAGVAPFESQCEAYGHYIQALRGIDVDAHVAYFRDKVAASDPDVDGDAPGRTLVRLLVSLGRTEEALAAVLEHVFEDAPWGTPVPTALQLCYQAGKFGKMRDLARERGDALSFVAAGILWRG